MIMEINAAIQSTKALSELLKATRELRNANEFAAAINEITAKLTQMIGVAAEAREKQLALADEVHELKKENMELKNWEREKERYSLTDITLGIPARILKPGMENGESTHPLCATCFENRKKSFLQYGTNLVSTRMACAECKGHWFPKETPRPPRIYRTPDPIQDESGKINY